MVTFTAKGLSQYNQLFIFACDTDSVVSRNMELETLCKSQPIPTRDLAQNKEIVDSGITESRLSNSLSASESVQIEDITSSQI